ncbi:hypothetical protein WP12_15190 [Sphingomonas sp. SRS2]|nr:hypothetical protein WP12_15190 [Sphingomonas sp. SRS2]
MEEVHCRGPRIQRELAQQTGISSRNMTQIIDSLEAEGIVARRPHPTDRRATLIELTGEGWRIADTELEPRVDEIASIFQELKPEQREALAEIAGQLVETLAKRRTEAR